jgi:hypothetical protein
MSSIVNKIKDALHHDKSTEAPEGTHGTHNSRVANAADPRIDSDRDHRAAPESTIGGTHSGTTGAYGTTGTGTTQGAHGPHDSKIANTVDPRVDSDRDGSRTVGGNSGAYGTTGTTGTHTGTHTGDAYGTTSSGTTQGAHGPHDSKVANTLDPRVDSDRDGSRTVGGITSSGGSSGAYGATSKNAHGLNATHHPAGIDNSFDPTTHGSHSNTHGTHGTHGTEGFSHSSAPGPAPTTAGPHKSDLLNKVDPRVDSNLDGSKTTGGNKTFAS